MAIWMDGLSAVRTARMEQGAALDENSFNGSDSPETKPCVKSWDFEGIPT